MTHSSSFTLMESNHVSITGSGNLTFFKNVVTKLSQLTCFQLQIISPLFRTSYVIQPAVLCNGVFNEFVFYDYSYVVFHPDWVCDLA